MLFAISVNDEGRAILDDDLHGDVLAVIEARAWTEARVDALGQKEMDPYNYRPGYGWFLGEDQCASLATA